MVAGSLLQPRLMLSRNAAIRSLTVQNLGGSRTQMRRLASSQAARKAPPTPPAPSTPKTRAAGAASSSTSSSTSTSTVPPTSSSSSTSTPSSSSSSSPNVSPTPTVPGKIGSTRQPTWLTRQLQASPRAMKVFLAITRALGYGTPKQVAGQRTFAIYEHICAVRPDEDKEFWQNGLYLPPTFQTWFTITNLHVWLLTVRFRALPAEHGRHYHQALIDHFFLDIEDRIRDILQPPSRPLEPYTFRTNFYVNPNAPASAKATGNSGSGQDTPEAVVEKKKQRRVRAPDRIVNQQMKIFKEQWQGMGLSFDMGLVKGDEELAGAVWRNLLGARGAQGIDYSSPSPSHTPSGSDPSSSTPRGFRRSINLVGGEVVDVSKIDVEVEQAKDDGSGVHDFPPSEVDKYLEYPERMLDIVRYVRRELKRLEGVSDEEIISGSWRKLRFGSVNEGGVKGVKGPLRPDLEL